MLEVARGSAPEATVVQGDALALPFPDATFDRVFTGHFYGHLEDERRRFLAEAGRVAAELVVVDSSRAAAEVDEIVQERVLNDGSRWEVYKRWFTGAGLAGRARRRRGAARRPLVRRRARDVVTYRSLAALKRDQSRAVPASRPATRSSRCR